MSNFSRIIIHKKTFYFLGLLYFNLLVCLYLILTVEIVKHTSGDLWKFYRINKHIWPLSITTKSFIMLMILKYIYKVTYTVAKIKLFLKCFWHTQQGGYINFLNFIIFQLNFFFVQYNFIVIKAWKIKTRIQLLLKKYKSIFSLV